MTDEIGEGVSADVLTGWKFGPGVLHDGRFGLLIFPEVKKPGEATSSSARPLAVSVEAARALVDQLTQFLQHPMAKPTTNRPQ